ncbi:MAG: cupin domain-containing protein [Pseudoprimorskyibacter sp.]|nr:cupin domain-containing protein [Pseudoprimorskyibacter sp.]
MEIFRAGSRPSAVGPSTYFTGRVRMDPVVTAEAPSSVSSLVVTFETGARTFWHTHPLGQVIHVLSGVGLAQTEGGPVRVIRPGDTVRFAPGARHWHGASPDTAMVHLAFQEAKDGSAVTWMDKVSEEDYRAHPQSEH